MHFEGIWGLKQELNYPFNLNVLPIKNDVRIYVAWQCHVHTFQ